MTIKLYLEKVKFCTFEVPKIAVCHVKSDIFHFWRHVKETLELLLNFTTWLLCALMIFVVIPATSPLWALGLVWLEKRDKDSLKETARRVDELHK